MFMIPRVNHAILFSYTPEARFKLTFLFPRWRHRSVDSNVNPLAGKFLKRELSQRIRDVAVDEKLPKSFVKFDNLLKNRRDQAKKSLVVQVQSEASCSELKEYCEKFSPVRYMFHYILKNNHLVLVEFKEDCLNEIMNSGCQLSERGSLPVVSPVVWFKAKASGKKTSVKNKDDCDDDRIIRVQTSSQENVTAHNSKTQGVSELMKMLCMSTELDELGTRLRFFTARQLELAMSGIFPHCAVLPFGSSVNGFGTATSDLDLVFRHHPISNDVEKANQTQQSPRLVFQTKTSVGGPRPLTQRQMELLADLLQVLLPGFSGVKRILQARVPIIKFSNDFTGLDCDLSMTNMSGVYMSELLFLYSQLDPHAKYLICFVKHWASAALLTNPSPGRWVTNFMLIMLCLHFLRTIKRLPPLDLMVSQASKEDERITDDINCTFIRDLSRLKWTPPLVTLSPSQLLTGFFEYYTRFDFATECVTITTDARVSKPDYSPIFIVNPLERSLNVAKNVSGEELEKLKVAFRSAAWKLESDESSASELLVRASQSSAWQPEIFAAASRRFVSPRMVTVKELFSDS